ncbi:hypothetical protein GCM10027597_47060 [Saccharopolyspora tripterygii]
MRCASDNRSSTSTPAPSAQPVPSALSANERQRPSEDRPPWRLNSMKVAGFDMTVTPPASAIEHSPLRSACVAMCMAASDDEHAVSSVTAGPTSPRV